MVGSGHHRQPSCHYRRCHGFACDSYCAPRRHPPYGRMGPPSDKAPCQDERIEAATTLRAPVGEANGSILFSDFDQDVRDAISSIDSELLLWQIKAALPSAGSGYSLAEDYKRIVETRRITLTVRKRENQAVFLCRVIATIHPTAKNVTFRVTSHGNVAANVEKFDEVAQDLLAGLLSALGKKSDSKG